MVDKSKSEEAIAEIWRKLKPGERYVIGLNTVWDEGANFVKLFNLSELIERIDHGEGKNISWDKLRALNAAAFLALVERAYGPGHGITLVDMEGRRF